MREISILIKTFLRPQACNRLIDSIRQYYKDIEILILDDSFEPTIYQQDTKQISSKPDIGISAGRNILVDNCKTPYCVILDDDCFFTDRTDLRKALEILKDNDYDLLEFKENDNFEYRGKFQVDGETVKYVRGEPLEFINNIFLAKTESLKKYGWDNSLKMGEHFAYFFKHRGKLKLGQCDISIGHGHFNNEEYDKYRDRSLEYLKMFMAKNNIKKRIDLHGNIIEL